MNSLWFCVPVHGRLPLAAICLRQLRRTCDDLVAAGVPASAVVVTDPASHWTLRKLIGRNLGFATVRRDNDFLGRRFNDGIQLATDPRYNPHPASHVVPCGSDDWVDARIFCDLPAPDTLVGFQRMSFVREDGAQMVTTQLGYEGGAGIRIIPRELVEPLGYRPAAEDRKRGCDTSILRNLRAQHGNRLRVEHRHLHDRQIVDWKTPGTQLNPFHEVTHLRRSSGDFDPFTELAGIYPAAAIEEMRGYYAALNAHTMQAA